MENIAKIVVLRSTGRKIGYVLDVAFDELLQKHGFYVVDEETEGEFFLSNKNVLAISDSYVLIESESVLEFMPNRAPGLMNKIVLDEKGTYLGCVQNLLFNGRRCVKIVTEKAEIASKLVRGVGEDFIFVGSRKKKTKKQTDNPFERVGDDTVVEIQNFQSSFKPEIVSLSTNFYVGKTCEQDIFGYNNEKIVGRGEVITRTIVERAKRHNKLNQLFFAIKR